MIRLTADRVRRLARAYDRATPAEGWARREAALKARLARRRRRGPMHLTRAELCWLGEWKTPRVRPLLARNTSAGVRELTTVVFMTAEDGRRMRLLCGLSGVGVAVASVVLHFAEPARYPVYDVRVRAALRRIGLRARFPATPEGWVRYVRCLRGLARPCRVSLRTLDKALWRLGGRPAVRR